ncbi:OadG family transporter subunit [Bowmanella dokdonensis]|uniref:Probable oxaloacetate decarboxylase gamma chain n=1 Tax=Bowmanella dokdonensis TaxID=751969 RepID=A0A939DSF6_9ALTE|nr:OadG family transporter subunit [Bowmanella dokdonensis]MBN7827066.1 OadG family protein [Bowmanella dokdonensis]
MDPNVTSLLQDAALLLLVGMVVVFAFLSLLIGVVNLISWICGRLPEPVQPVHELKRLSPSVGPSPAVVAAITAAVHKYRQE